MNFHEELEKEKIMMRIKILEMYVTDLDLSFYATKNLILNGIETVRDIVSYTEEEMLCILGERTYLDEVKYKLKALEVSFKNSAVEK